MRCGTINTEARIKLSNGRGMVSVWGGRELQYATAPHRMRCCNDSCRDAEVDVWHNRRLCNTIKPHVSHELLMDTIAGKHTQGKETCGNPGGAVFVCSDAVIFAV